MQINIGSPLLTHLRTRDRKMTVLYEIYDTDYQPGSSGFDPRDALETFAGIGYTLPFGPVTYRRQVLRGTTVKKTTGKEFNTATIRFSNVEENEAGFRYMSQFVLNNQVEQMRLVIRAISRSVATSIGNDISLLNNSIVLFVGRCGKPDAFNRSTGTITAKPDMGTTAAQIPPRQFQSSCPLEYKGPECLGTELLSEKSATFQNETICKFTIEDCTRKGNQKFFQGQHLVQIESSFIHKSHEGFWRKLVKYGGFGVVGSLLLPKRRQSVVGNSVLDATPYGNPIPLIFGRWSKDLLPLQYQDIGTSINFLMAACRGKISDFINIVNLSLGFTQPIGVTKHLGEFGGQGTQTQDTVFPEHEFFSRLAYVTGYCNGSDIETEDPAPEISAVIAGIIPDQIYFDVDHDGTGKLAAGTGGVTAPGTSTTAPAAPAASFDAALFEIGTPTFYFKTQETSLGNEYPVAPGGMADSSGNGNHAWYLPPSISPDVTLDISSPEVPVETDSASRFVDGGFGFLPAASGSSLDPRGNQTWIAIARMTAHAPQSYIMNRGSDTTGGVAFGLSFGNGLGTETIFANWGNGAIQGPGQGDGQLSFGPVPQDGTPFLIATVREGTSIKLYFQGCLVDEDLFPAGDIVFSDFNESPWRFGYTPNIVFGPVEISDGASHLAMFNGIAATADQISRLWASMRITPTGCPGEDWVDNPVDFTQYVLTDPSLMGNDINSIDTFQSAYAAAWNCGAIKDDSNAERCLLPNTETSKAGVDYKRYNSTGLLTPESFQSTRTQIPAGVPARQCEYEFFDPSTPPSSLTTKIFYRKRYTFNREISSVTKVVDFLYDTIFPSFNGFLRWNIKGQTVIDSARPADWTSLKSASLATATTITVRDVLPWKNILGSPYLLEGKIHLDRRISYQYDNAAMRTGASGFTAGDVGKFAFQKDNNTKWQLTATTPTWTQVTAEVSEVRPVTLAQYSALGDNITLAASASGGPTAVASGATLSGGSTTVQSSGTVTITGSLTQGATATVTIDGIDCVLNLLANESSSTIGHRMACVINATPEVQEYVEAHAVTNVVTIKAKIGVLTLASALENAHEAQTEVTRVMASFAGKALAYADTTRANILDDSFSWPDASRQSLVNQIKAEHRESVRDFGKQPIVVNDFNHQRKTRKIEPFEVDHSAIDNYNQSARLANGLLNKLRDGDQFFSWGSAGEPLLLDEGDVVCVSDDSGPFRNQLVRLEEIEIKEDVGVMFAARKYSRMQLSDLVALPAALLLPSGLSNFEAPPPNISFNETDFPPSGVIQSTDGSAGITSIRGGVVFSASIYPQFAKIRVTRRAGIVVDEPLPGDYKPNAQLKASFEFLASADGLYTIEARACNQWGCSTAITVDIVIGFGTLFGIAKQGGILIAKQGGTLMEQEHA